MVRYDLNLFEVWKPVPGYEGLYEISSEGRVWSNRNHLFLKYSIDKGGYCTVYLCKGGVKKTHFIHRLVAKAFIQNTDNLPQVNHKDENPANNNCLNLEWCDAKYNSNYGSRINRIHNTKLQKGQILGLSPDEYKVKWREEHKEHLRDYWRNYRKEHREEYNSYIRNRRQNKKERV